MNHAEDRSSAPLGSRYGFQCVLQNVAFDHAVTRVTEALKAEGFGVLTDIDVQATMKSKLGTDMSRYRILGACNPSLAHRALGAEPSIGLLLPCNVVVREEFEDRVVIGFMDPVAIMQSSSNPVVAKVAHEVRQRLERVRFALATQAPGAAQRI